MILDGSNMELVRFAVKLRLVRDSVEKHNYDHPRLAVEEQARYLAWENDMLWDLVKELTTEDEDGD